MQSDDRRLQFVAWYVIGVLQTGPGPAMIVSWTSSYSDSGVLGEAELATVEKVKAAYAEAVKQLVRLVTWFKDRPKDERRSHHRKPPTMPMPWRQQTR